jgi:hypothetical protein
LYAKTKISRLKSARKWRIKSKYGMTLEEYYRILLEQGNRCAICKREFSEGQIPQLDHHHGTAKIRGFLCILCNTSLRALDADRDWGVKALAYLEEEL